MSNFRSPEIGDFDNYFITNVELIDRLVQGGLWNWGRSDYGQLGDSTVTSKSSPVQNITGGTTWKQVACGYNHTAAIKTDGTLWIWGKNDYCQLGDSTKTHRSSPVQTIAAGTTWKQVACGYAHTVAIKTDGTLWLWGYNYDGQLGDSTRTNRSSPIQTIAGGTTWKQVACGFSGNTAAIKTDGTLWLWGDDIQGQLGRSTTNSPVSSPVQTICGGTNWKQVSCGQNLISSIKTDGTLWVWGYNNDGQLGVSTYGYTASSPIQTIAGGNDWKQVSCGPDYIAAVKTDGSLWLWGYNYDGQLGNNNRTSRSSPVQTIAAGTTWKQVSAGYAFTAAVKTDGSLWLWGSDGYGQLGNNATANKSSPVQTVAGGNNWKQVSCGKYHTSAVQYSDIGQVL